MKQSDFEEAIIGYIERRKGQPVDDEFINKFATFLWRKKIQFELSVMRSMTDR